MKTIVFIYFLINAISPAIPNNMNPSIPYAEILINNHIAEIINIIPPVFALFFTYTDPTIPTMDAKSADIPKANISVPPNDDNIIANTPPSKPKIAPIIPKTSSKVLDVSFAVISLVEVSDFPSKLYPHFIQNVALSSFSVPQETQNFIFSPYIVIVWLYIASDKSFPPNALSRIYTSAFYGVESPFT